jgi:hypothetical protein
MKGDKSLNKATIARFCIIERLLFWEGEVNATRLAALFGITFGNATLIVANYRELHPDSLTYNQVAKVFEPGQSFELHYATPHWADYESFLLVNKKTYMDNMWSIDSVTLSNFDLNAPDKEIVRLLTKSIRNSLSMTVKYHSMNHPDGIERTIHPRAIAYSGLRWHCRAYDELNNRFGDFNLGRITEGKIVGKSSIDIEDEFWVNFIKLEVGPHPALNKAQQRLVMMDKPHSEQFEITTRAAMANYVLDFYQIAHHHEQHPPHVRPLILLNFNSVKEYLF